MENQFLSKLIKNAPHLKWFPFPFIQLVNALLSLKLTTLPPPTLPHPTLPSHLSSLQPSFALLLSTNDNYLHKSFFALWFAPFHKWRLSLFNRGGFASHVKAYNVAGPWFLHTPAAAHGLSSHPQFSFPIGLDLLGREVCSKVKAYWAWGSLQWIRLHTHWLNWKRSWKLLKITSG